MIALRHAVHRLRSDARGSTLVEFTFVGPLFFMMIFGLFDITHQLYVRSTLQGEVEKAGRDSGLQTGVANATTIDNKVRTMMLKVAPGATLVFERKTYADFSNIASAEPFTDTNNNGIRNSTECYQDINGNSIWDADSSSTGQGGASASVVYKATATVPHLFPVMSFFTASPTQTMSASTILRNQPYAAGTTPAIRCI
jgi:Flp pilus assembly protein TadG